MLQWAKLPWRIASHDLDWLVQTSPAVINWYPMWSQWQPSIGSRMDNGRRGGQCPPLNQCYTTHWASSWMFRCLLRSIDLVFNRSINTSHAKELYPGYTVWFPQHFEVWRRLYPTENEFIESLRGIIFPPCQAPRVFGGISSYSWLAR